MGFKDDFTMLYTHFSEDKETQPDFFIAAIGALVDTDENDDSFKLLEHPKKFYNNIIGSDGKTISSRDADFIINHHNMTLGPKFFTERLTQSNDSVIETARDLQFANPDSATDEEIGDKAACLLVEMFRPFTSQNKKKYIPDPSSAIKELERQLKALPSPKKVSVPSDPEENEMEYINALFEAYSDDYGAVIDTDNMPDEYADDLKDRRIDYFAAESVHRGLAELDHKTDFFNNQFDVLKEETWNGVKDTYKKVKRDHTISGYTRLLDVMEQATVISVDAFVLSKSPNWINNNVKKGVCHFLVIDGKIRWV